MISKREEISRGGGSVRVGSVGTISSLMSKELKSSSSTRRNPQSAPVSVSCADGTFRLRKPMNENTRRDRISVLATPKRQKQKATPEEARRTDLQSKARNQKRAHHVPMLGPEDAALGNTANRDKSGWKVSIVEVVDTKCGIPAGPLSNRLKKLGFAKLSQSII